MATFVRLMESRGKVVDQLFENKRDAENHRNKEFLAALKIQSWFRGTKVRAYLRFLHYCATTVQRHFRGHKGREIYRQIVQEKVAMMRTDFFNKQATLIQKLWRGYYVRKYIYNYHSRKRYLEGVILKNEVVRKELEEFALKSKQEKEQKREMEEKLAKEEKARKTHYYISTHQIPGVYNSPFFPPQPSAKEIELRNARPLSRRSRQKLKSDAAQILDQSRSVKMVTRESKTVPLPPISMKSTAKVQGPFHTPNEVWQQRHKPLNPTLRVATSYLSAEDARADMKADEWVTRLIDDKVWPARCPDYYVHDKQDHWDEALGRTPPSSRFKGSWAELICQASKRRQWCWTNATGSTGTFFLLTPRWTHFTLLIMLGVLFIICSRFVPCTHRERPYEPLLHTTSQYGSLPYGTKHFREENVDRHITPSRFQRVASPIPIFEQFGKTY